MNSDELSALSNHLKCVGIKAVNIDRYLMRRAWAIYYSIWAFSIFLFIFISYPIGFIRQGYIQLSTFIVSYILIVIFASYFSGIAFAKARRLASPQRNLSNVDNKDTDKNSLTGILVFILIIAVMIIISSGIIRTILGILSEAAFLGFIDMYVYRMLKKSLGRTPYEGLMAVFVFLFSDIGSALSVIIFRSSEYFAYFWIPTVAAWFLASIYSMFHSGDELANNPEMQECS